MWARYKADGADLNKIPSLAEQRASGRNLNTVRPSYVPGGADDEKDNLDFEGMLAAEEVAASDVCGKLREGQCISENGGDAVPTTLVDVVELVREGIETNRKNTTLSSRQTDLEAKLVEIRAAGHTMRAQNTAGHGRIKAPETQLTNALFALERLPDESFWTEAELRSRMVAIEESFEAEKAHIDAFIRKLATEAEKMQQLLNGRRETRQTESRSLAEDEDCLEDIVKGCRHDSEEKLVVRRCHRGHGGTETAEDDLALQ